jgi:hypothetical protein
MKVEVRAAREAEEKTYYEEGGGGGGGCETRGSNGGVGQCVGKLGAKLE